MSAQKRKEVLKTSRNIILGAIAILRKSTTSCVIHVCLSVRLSVHMEQLGLQRRDFKEIWIFYYI